MITRNGLMRFWRLAGPKACRVSGQLHPEGRGSPEPLAMCTALRISYVQLFSSCILYDKPVI